MVDVGQKKVSRCLVRVQSIVIFDEKIMDLLEKDEISIKKGFVFQIVILVGIMVVKKMGEFILFCYLFGLDNCYIDI